MPPQSISQRCVRDRPRACAPEQLQVRDPPGPCGQARVEHPGAERVQPLREPQHLERGAPERNRGPGARRVEACEFAPRGARVQAALDRGQRGEGGREGRMRRARERRHGPR